MKTYIVDCFTKDAFKGNTSGVCHSTNQIIDEQMLNIANESGLSETAFIWETR